MAEKVKILVVGFGGIGTITAYNLEASGLAEVTGVLRSNYQTVSERGFKIQSCDYGKIEGWRPSTSTYNAGLTFPSLILIKTSATGKDPRLITSRSSSSCPECG
jgi:ketopantoate reductase